LSDYEKPKRDAETERLLKQFTTIDGPKGASQAFRDGWDRIFGHKAPLFEEGAEFMCSCCGCIWPLESESTQRGTCWCCYEAHERGD
jgi:hypothetical protein